MNRQDQSILLYEQTGGLIKDTYEKFGLELIKMVFESMPIDERCDEHD